MRAVSLVSPQRLITVLIAVFGLVVGGSAVALSVQPATALQVGAPVQTKYIYPSDGNPVEITSTSFVDVATTSVTIPANTKAVIDARYSATSVCVSSPPHSQAGCFVRILIGGVEGQPNGVNLSVFDSVTDTNTGDYQEAHMIERIRGPLGPGTYAVKVQAAVPAADTTLALINWLLVVQRVKA